MWETLASPTGCSLPAGSVNVPSSSGEETDHDQVLPCGRRRPAPVQNAGPQRTVQSKNDGSPRAPSMVKTWRPAPIATNSSSSTEMPVTVPSKHPGVGSGAHGWWMPVTSAFDL